MKIKVIVVFILYVFFCIRNSTLIDVTLHIRYKSQNWNDTHDSHTLFDEQKQKKNYNKKKVTTLTDARGSSTSYIIVFRWVFDADRSLCGFVGWFFQVSTGEYRTGHDFTISVCIIQKTMITDAKIVQEIEFLYGTKIALGHIECSKHNKKRFFRCFFIIFFKFVSLLNSANAYTPHIYSLGNGLHLTNHRLLFNVYNITNNNKTQNY